MSCEAHLIKLAECEAGDKTGNLAGSPRSQVAEPLRTGLACLASRALHRGPGSQQASAKWWMRNSAYSSCIWQLQDCRTRTLAAVQSSDQACSAG